MSQWIPSIRKSSFNLAGLVTYSFYTVSDTFSEVTFGETNETLNSVVVDGESFVFNLIASKQIKKFNISSAIGLTSSKFEYSLGGKGYILLPELNKELDTLNEGKTNFKADIGVDYRFYDFSVNTMLTFGSYTNLVLGVNYNL